LKDITVVKFGGSLSKDEKLRHEFLKGLAALSKKRPVVLVHGGGPEINNWLERLGIQSRFINGLRYTDAATLEVVEMVLSGRINKAIVSILNRFGVKAVGLSGKDSGMLLCKRNESLGFVGEPVRVNTGIIKDLLAKKYLPVISSLGFDAAGNTMNINADTAAMAAATALKAGKLVLLTDVQGVLDNNDRVIPVIKLKDIPGLIASGTVTGGMIPKLKACAKSVKAGVREVWIAHGSSDLNRLRGTVIKR
jgi:acetylglutamate kinase